MNRIKITTKRINTYTMKQVLTFLLAVMITATGVETWAQKKNVRNASKIATDAESTPSELQEALNLLESAKTDEKTKDDPETYFTIGQVYKAIAKDSTKTLMVPLEAAKKAHENYEKAIEMEGSGDKYENLIEAVENQDLYAALYNEGVAKFQGGAFEDATEIFEFTQVIAPTDTNSYLNAGNAAINLQDYERAAENFYGALDLGYENFDLYYKLIVIEVNQTNNLDKAIELLETAREKFPDEQDIGKLEIDILIKQNKVEDAIEKVEDEIARNPDDVANRFRLASLYYNLALAEEEKEETDTAKISLYYNNAITQYKEILKVEPDNFNANYFTGLLYLYDSKVIYDAINALPMKEYMKVGDAKTAIADAKLANAIPYLEKAATLDQDNLELLRNLQVVYAQLKMNEKADKLYKQLEDLGYYDDKDQG